MAISVALLWWTLHDVNLAEMWRHMSRVRAGWLLAAVTLATLTFPLRTVRWRYLLRFDGDALPFAPLWHATAIGFMANNLLPARAGEVARAFAAANATRVRFSAAFASLAVERVLDGLTLVVLLTVAIWAGGFAPGTVVGGVTLGGVAKGAGLLFAALLVGALVFVHWPGPALGAARAVANHVLPTRWAGRLVGFVEGTLSGLDALKSPRRFAVVVFWSFAVWGAAAGSFLLAFLAFGIDVPWTAALLLQALIAFGVAIPASPGFFGVFEAVSRVSLALYGVSAERAVSYAVGYHITTFLPITLLGIWSLGRVHLHFADLRAPEAEGSAGETGAAEATDSASTAGAPVE
ncbi:MAG: lysylphosphatidylglycerol synthase transmembrane domain-containing protein [Gemmatimonadales bacterium]